MPLNEDAIAKLPLWCAVGFAALCARRVLGHVRAGCGKAPGRILDNLEQAVAIAEEFAARGAGRVDYTAQADGDHAVDAAQELERWVVDESVRLYSDAPAGAAYAAGCAADLAAGAAWGRRDLVYANAWRAVRGALACTAEASGLEEAYVRLAERVKRDSIGDAAPFVPQWLHEVA